MTGKVQAIRGMNDVLPSEAPHWQYVERVLTELTASYGYQEIRFPLVEHTELFNRSVGEITDIVEKEMYTFIDRSGDSLTLRPEGTAGCARAAIEHGLLYNQTPKLWYMGPLFRHERPQKGRYRQFHQFALEAFGISNPEIDAEIILFCARLWKMLGLTDYLKLELGTLGSPLERKHYREDLVNYLKQHHESLDEDSQRRLHTNPLRILDSKNPGMQSLIHDAPKLIHYLGDESKAHFERLCQLLDAASIHYTVNTRLVRGLDYYCNTVFEWTTDHLGAQATVCGGGRYDGLVGLLGGQPTPAVGFAMGIERLILLLETLNLIPAIDEPADIFIIAAGDPAMQQGLVLAEQLRDHLPMQAIIMNCAGGSFKSQMKKADHSGARVAIILGNDEIENQTVSIKYLREDQPQISIPLNECIQFLSTLF